MDRLRSAVGLGRSVRNDGDEGLLDPLSLNSSLLGGQDPGLDESSAQNEDDGRRHVGRSGGSVDVAANLGDDDALTEEMRREEEQIYSEIRARKIVEEEDRKLAQRLQEEMHGSAPPLRIKVVVPPRAFGGFFIRVQIPGKPNFEQVQVPPGLAPGDEFTYITRGDGQGVVEGAPAPEGAAVPTKTRVRVPTGVLPGQTFSAVLSGGTRVVVTVPEGTPPGGFVDIVNPPPGAPDAEGGAVMPELSEAERREREAFLAALPDDIRAEILAQEGGLRAVEQSLQQQQQQAADGSGGGSGGSSSRDSWVQMVQVTIPAGVEAGQEFRAQMPGGESVMIQVPPGFSPGDVLGVPASAGREEGGAAAAWDSPEPPSTTAPAHDAEREAFLAALPDNIRAEVEAAERQEAGARVDSGPPAPPAPTPAAVEDDLLTGGASGTAASSETAAPSGTADSSGTAALSGTAASEDLLSYNDVPEPAPAVPPPPAAAAPELDLLSGDASGSGDVVSGDVVGGDAAGETDLLSGSETAAADNAPAAQQPGGSPSSGGKPPLERLKEAKAQLERGEITPEEFSAIKKDVIASI